MAKTEEKGPCTGFKQEQYYNGGDRFPVSDYECSVSALDELRKYKKIAEYAGVKIININERGGCKNWKDCGINDKKYHHFLIMPGDYRAWGMLQLRTSGTEAHPRIIAYYNPTQQDALEPQLPVHTPLNPKAHVILEAFEIVQKDYWILNGLTFSGNSDKTIRGKKGGRHSRFALHAKHNIINRCLFENGYRDCLIRISFSDYNCIQNSIVRNMIGGDQVGILVKGEQDRAVGNRIVNNEIYDCNDGIQLTYSKSYGTKGFASGTIIENNDIYLTPQSYSKTKKGFACAENAIDIKIGGESNSPDQVVQILKNRMWGFRPTDISCGGSGGSGGIIGAHIKANNIIFKDNVIFDGPEGLAVGNQNLPNTKIAIINNIFFNIRKFDKSRNFALAIRAGVTTDIYYNTIKGAEQSLRIGEKTIGRAQCNTIIGIPQIFRWEKSRKNWSALNAWYGCKIEDRGPYSHDPRLNVVENRADQSKFGDFTFYRKRWTKPEKVIVKNVFPNNSNQIGRVSSSSNHCGEGGEGNRWWLRCIKW